MRWVGHIACMRDLRNACRILVISSEGKRLLRGLGGYKNDRIGGAMD
jgi:hypothetical protein